MQEDDLRVKKVRKEICRSIRKWFDLAAQLVQVRIHLEEGPTGIAGVHTALEAMWHAPARSPGRARRLSTNARRRSGVLLAVGVTLRQTRHKLLEGLWALL
jgi:hypothetical protein